MSETSANTEVRYPDCDSIRAIPPEQWDAWLVEDEPFDNDYFFSPDELAFVVHELDKGGGWPAIKAHNEELCYRAMVYFTVTEAAVKRLKQSRRKRRVGSIYFVQARPGDPIKIGFAIDPTKRLGEIQTGHPYALRILAVESGTRKSEGELHRRFARERLSGEWFKPSKRLRDYIEGLA